MPLYIVDDISKPSASFLLASGSRCFVQRRFYEGQQVGCQILIRDYELGHKQPDFTVEYVVHG